MHCDKYRCNRKFLDSFFEEGNYEEVVSSIEGLELAKGLKTIAKELKCKKLWRVVITRKTTPVDSDTAVTEVNYFYANGAFVVKSESVVIAKSHWVRTKTGICVAGKYSGSFLPLVGKSSLKDSKGSEDGLTTYTSILSDVSSGKCAPKYSLFSKKLLE